MTIRCPETTVGGSCGAKHPPHASASEGMMTVAVTAANAVSGKSLDIQVMGAPLCREGADENSVS
jgi:hypothetical protein